MKNRSIDVIVMPDGQLIIDVVGLKGPDCEKATRFLEEALGQIASKQRKPAYNERNRTQTKQRVGS